MEQFSNRVEQELLQFKAREERLGKLFPAEDGQNGPLPQEEIKQYVYLLAKYKAAQNPDERYLLKRIQIQKEKLEKELYPNGLVQLLRKAFRFLTAEKRYADSFRKEALRSREKLFDAVKKSGFKIPSEIMLKNLESGSDRFTVAVSHYVNEKEHMKHELLFLKDISGGYGFEGFKAALHNESSPESSREHFFKNSQTIYSPQDAFHMLCGRAVEKDGSWHQLDLNDRSVSGSYRIKEFRPDYGFSLKNALEALPLKDKNEDKIDYLLRALRSGEAQSATILVKDREYHFSICANPQFKAVDIYDEHLKKINLSALRGRTAKKEGQKRSSVNNVKQKNKRAVRIQ